MDAIPENQADRESATFIPDPGKTEKQNQKALERFASRV